MEKNTEKQNVKRRSTFAVLFYINRTKVRKDGMCQLLCKVSIDAEWAQIGTKVSVNPGIWNPEKGRANGRSENAVTVNRAIDDLTREIAGHYERIRNSLGFITAELVKNAVKGIGQKPLTLLALFKEHNEEFRKRVGIDRIQETYDSYQRSYKHLSAFVREKKGVEDVTLRSLDRTFYDDFEVFLRTDRNLKPKSVHEHLYRLKKLTMRAVSQGTLRRDPYCRLHPELPKRKSRHMKLEDLKTLMTTPVEKPQLQFVRDMFIFSTFTGLAYADLKRLSDKDITQTGDGTWWIHIHRKKTDTLSSVLCGLSFGAPDTQHFYNLLTAIPIAGELTDDTSPQAQPMITLTFNLRDGETDILEFLPINTSYCAVSVNGEAQFATYANVPTLIVQVFLKLAEIL